MNVIKVILLDLSVFALAVFPAWRLYRFRKNRK
jgi:hypothetical protein